MDALRGVAPGGLGLAVATLALLLLVPSLLPPAGASIAGPGPPRPPLTATPAAIGPFPSVRPAAPAPLVTGAWDWDPQPFYPPLTIPANEVAGLGAAMATSDRTGNVLLFGGEGYHGLTNVTAVVSEATGNWQRVLPPSAPSPRANFTLSTFGSGRSAVLFGGLTSLTNGRSDNSTWVYSFVNQTWTNVTHGPAPPPREGAAMAVDDAAGVAILEGGRDRAYQLNGSGASVLWNDTWSLNLTTFNWTRLTPSGAPPPMFGSAMVFAPPEGTFYLFGGCASFCTNATYAYRPGGNWSRLPVSGDSFPARGGASAVWDPLDNVSFVGMGLEPGATSYAALNDTYMFTPSPARWDLVASPGGPPNRYGAAAAFLAANQCPGVFLLGGSPVLTQPPADGWFLDTNPDLGAGCNTWGGDQVGGSGGGGGANCTPAANLSVRVVAHATGRPLGNASVTISGACGRFAAPTSRAGYANFSALPHGPLTILASDAGFHGNSTVVNLTGPNLAVTVFLDALPNVFIRTFGASSAGTGPLSYVALTFDGITDLGLTDPAGWLNLTPFSGASGPGSFEAVKPGYSNATVTESVPYTGNLSFTMTLLADGAFDVQVVEVPDGTPIVGAVGTIVPVGADTFGGPVPFTTGPAGWFNASLPRANYTVRADYPGFLPNATRGPVFHSWMNATVVVLNLTLAYGANVSVRLLDAVTHDPIPGGNVTIGYLPGRTTGAAGWANFTDILPPGRYVVAGTAPGYLNNATTVDLTYRSLVTHLELNLTPIPPCSPLAPCPGGPNGTRGVFSLLPPGGPSLDLILLAPLLLAVAGAAYVVYLRQNARARGA